jgi:methylated-DNA-[protein]-cysteine S-methyltransferase/AraC family transcriptional regulator of adaptative response/methylated-DNA-[protein]-cysteine methyltransferase
MVHEVDLPRAGWRSALCLSASELSGFERKDRSEHLLADDYFNDRDIEGVTQMDLNIRTDSARTNSHALSEEIAFATGTSALGTVLVAGNAHGVCAILIGSEAGELVADLAVRFPHNTLVQQDRKLDGELMKILRFIEKPTRGLDLELNINGTPFQRRVWDALCGIPAGQTITYAALAHRVGKPGAVRAVANACAANAIALAIPCHRVIGSDGTLSGYRWGVERKRALLAWEAEV